MIDFFILFEKSVLSAPNPTFDDFVAPIFARKTKLELVRNFLELKINRLWFWINENQGVYRDK